MKTISIFIALVAICGVNKASAQQITSAEIQVTGLTCSMCSQATEKSLRTLPYIDQITPDLNKNIFLVTFKKNSPVNFDQINKKIKDAGFSVGKMDALLNFNQLKIDEAGQAIVGSNVYRFVNVKNKSLNGPVKVSVVDKNYISNSAFKQKSATIKLDSYQTGTGMVNGKKTRIYHLSI